VLKNGYSAYPQILKMSHNYLIFLYYVITPKSEEPNISGE